jgi:hypothetical protein
MRTACSVRAAAASSAPSNLEMRLTSDAGKLSSEEIICVSVKASPGSPSSAGSKWNKPLGFSFRSRARSSADSDVNASAPPLEPAPDTFSGRVTRMSVPTPVSGASAFSCASSSPADSALTTTTRPTPIARPRAVSAVRPGRRRSSAAM